MTGGERLEDGVSFESDSVLTNPLQFHRGFPLVLLVLPRGAQGPMLRLGGQ